MTTQQKAIIGGCIIAAFIFFQSKPKEVLTASDIEPIMIRTELAFKQAESKILTTVPDDDVEPLGPDPDVNKCICKGTGRYERPDLPGSGKMVDCPYHSSSQVKTINSVQCESGSCKVKSSVYVPQRRGWLFRK
jgi:hypothetical protein